MEVKELRFAMKTDDRRADCVSGIILTRDSPGISLAALARRSSRVSINNPLGRQEFSQPIGEVRGDAINSPVDEFLPIRWVVDGPGNNPQSFPMNLFYLQLIEELKVWTIDMSAGLANKFGRRNRSRSSDQNGSSNLGRQFSQDPNAAMIEASEASPVQHIRRARCLDDPLLQNARRLAVKAITNNSWSKRHSLKLEIEPNFVRLGLLLAGFSNQPTRITGIGGCESKQVSQRGRREGVYSLTLRVPKR